MTKILLAGIAALGLSAGAAFAATSVQPAASGYATSTQTSARTYASNMPQTQPSFGSGSTATASTANQALPGMEVGAHGFALFPPDALGGGDN